MPEYEGFVASLKEDGKAEVIVQPETSDIVGAPGVSKKVCHCASSSSQVTVEALNPVRAAVGDRVAVRVDASLLLRNAGALIGMPVLALALGWAVSFFIPESELLGVPVRFLCLFCSLPLGVAVGVLLYRNWSRRNLPSIIRIIQTREEMASSFAAAQEPVPQFTNIPINPCP
jgi:hypothetical protein